MTPAQTSLSPAELAPRLRLAIMRLSRLLRQETQGPATPSQTSALHSIERLEPVTLSDLAAAERIQPPSMTRIVSALEENGYVTREVDLSDRRYARLRLTPEGRKLLERGRERRTAYLASRLRKLGAEDVAALERALPLIERLIEGDA
ncbi:MAG: MarR family transcriptional regulator [Actinobacteria bacterium]|nr:MarR family transcriptional regulator [Actinomycetota bacterium]